MRKTLIIPILILLAGGVLAQDEILTLENALIKASEKVSPAIVSIDMTGARSVLEDDFFSHWHNVYVYERCELTCELGGLRCWSNACVCRRCWMG